MTATEAPFDGIALTSGTGGTVLEPKDAVKIALRNTSEVSK